MDDESLLLHPLPARPYTPLGRRENNQDGLNSEVDSPSSLSFHSPGTNDPLINRMIQARPVVTDRFDSSLRKQFFQEPSNIGRATRSDEIRNPESVAAPLLPGASLNDTEANTTNLTRRSWPSVLTQLQYSWRLFYGFLLSPTLRSAMKCAVTYLLASLFVFSPTLSRMLGPGDGKHFAATATVYFHASRSVGSMIEATLFAEAALLYSACLSVLSMLTARFFDQLDRIIVGHAIVLIVFCAGGLGSIAFMKQKMNLPTFNTACSLASVSFATILIHEGSIQNGQISFSKMIQVSILVNTGILIAATVCFLVFPYTAVSKLNDSLNNTMNLYSKLLSTMTTNFIEESSLGRSDFDATFKSVNSSLMSLDSVLRETMYERCVMGTVPDFYFQRRLVKSVQQLSQHVGGLKSSYYMKLRLMDIEPGYRQASCSELFDVFVYYLGPKMTSFSDKLCESLRGIPIYDGKVESLERLRSIKEGIRIAKLEFSEARASALHELYSMDAFRRQVIANNEEIGVYLEEIASICGQFSYGLLDFADGLCGTLAVLEDHQLYRAVNNPRSWSWAKFWERAPLENRLSSSDRLAVPQTLSQLFNDDSVTVVSDEEYVPLGLRLWRMLRALRRSDVRYGIKVGLGAMIFTLPAYLDITSSMFHHYRGEWGLISFVIVMNISIGGTLTAAFYRILGTILGTFIAYIAWQIFPFNSTALALIGFVMAFGCFHIILTGHPNSVFGRFILLTFNLTALYSYNLGVDDNDDDDDDEGGVDPVVGEIALHRLVAVVLGVLWGVVITLYVARAELKRKLGILWTRMGLLWKADPLGRMVTPQEAAIRPKFAGLQDEQLMAKSLLQLKPLVALAEQEFRLKGRFPREKYDTIVQVTGHILDAYHNVNSMILSRGTSELEKRIIQYTEFERKELSNRIFLLFYILSSALRLGLPLPDHLPNTERARDRMISKVNEFRVQQMNDADFGKEDDFVLFYSFILSTLAINDGLMHITALLQQIYGAIEDEALTI